MTFLILGNHYVALPNAQGSLPI